MADISYLIWTEGNVHTGVMSDFRYNKQLSKGRKPVFGKHYAKSWGKHLPHKVYVKLYDNARKYIRNS